MNLILLLICFGASLIGAICGVGGGVIIKPVVDSLGILSVSVLSFLSGCTVLAMTSYSVLAGKIKGNSKINAKTTFPLAIGAATGGIAGKLLFQTIMQALGNENRVGMIQSIILLLVTLGTFLYTLRKDWIKTLSVNNSCICVVIGLMLGIMSVFLGIGGGPINLVVLYYFFSMETKEAAENSLYIIFFSQLFSLLFAIVGGTVPQIQAAMLIFMMSGGILGGICGRVVNRKISSKTVDKLFCMLMIFIMVINVFNIMKFYQV